MSQFLLTAGVTGGIDTKTGQLNALIPPPQLNALCGYMCVRFTAGAHENKMGWLDVCNGIVTRILDGGGNELVGFQGEYEYQNSGVIETPQFLTKTWAAAQPANTAALILNPTWVDAVITQPAKISN